MIDEKELDDQLEESLRAVEAGRSAADITAALPEDEEAELESLLRLASSIRDTPLATLSASARERIANAVIQTNTEFMPRPALRWDWVFGRSFAAAVVQAYTKNKPRLAFGWDLAAGRKFASAAVLLFLLLVGSGLWWYGPLPAHAATLADVSGKVSIGNADGSDWHAASAGELVRSGAIIRTGPAGSVTLAFFEGSRSTFGPSSDFSLERVDGRWGDVLQVELSQQAGSARYNIVPFRDSDANFLVYTPSGSASVHGTVFAVTVDQLGQALFSVERGNVAVVNKNKMVTLTAGQATSSKPGQEPQPATFLFNSNNKLTHVDGSTWNVAGVPIEITEETAIKGDPQVGESVVVEGRISDDGQWVADKISGASDTGSEFQLTGTVQSMTGGSWNINGANVLINDTTEIGGDITRGDTVLVVYTSLNGGRLATKIVKLDAVNNGSEILCAGANPQSKGQELAAQYGVRYDEIMSWYCRGFGFGEIDQVYGLSSDAGLPPSDIFTLRRQGLDWDAIKRQLGLVTLTDTPTPVIASETDTPMPTDTLEPTATDTPEPTQTVAPTDTAVPTDTLVPEDTPTQPDTIAPAKIPTSWPFPTPAEAATPMPDITITDASTAGQ